MAGSVTEPGTPTLTNASRMAMTTTERGIVSTTRYGLLRRFFSFTRWKRKWRHRRHQNYAIRTSSGTHADGL